MALIDNSQKAVMYIGPTIKGTSFINSQLYIHGYPEEIQEKVKEDPLFLNLFVYAANYRKAKDMVGAKGSSLNIVYNKIQQKYCK